MRLEVLKTIWYTEEHLNDTYTYKWFNLGNSFLSLNPQYPQQSERKSVYVYLFKTTTNTEEKTT